LTKFLYVFAFDAALVVVAILGLRHIYEQF
jgi:hypothetical protein